MLKVLTNTDYAVMPWKNGLGTTTQIEINPLGSTFPEDDFLWRVSSATVRTSNPFSKFPGYDRLLAVWQGCGLRLNGKNLTPSNVVRFSGEEFIQGDLIDGEVLDLGVIFHRDFIQAEMTYASTLAGQSLELYLNHDVHFIFCAQGSFCTEGHTVKEGECLRVEKLKFISVSAAQTLDLKIYLIQLSRR